MSSRGKALTILAMLGVLSAGLLAWQVAVSVGGGLQAGFDSEFFVRPDGYPGLQKAYGLEFQQHPMHMDPGLMYKACAWGWVDVICGFATDGRIAAYDLAMLDDDRHFFPPYYAAPLIRAETLQKHPELSDVLNRLQRTIDDPTMQRLNLEVDRDENPREPENVARDFLVQAGLIQPDAQPRSGSAGTVVIGGKNFTEQEILGEIMAILIEIRTDLAVERKFNLGGTMICFNALKSGDLDLYAEYTGTGLVSILDRPVIADPDETFRVVKNAFRKEFDLVWLKPFGFNNTYTLTMRKAHAEQLGIDSISDLAEYLRNERPD